MSRATLEQLTTPRTTEVTVNVDGEPATFLIQKIKVGQRRRINKECLDEDGYPDLEEASRLACIMCVVEPALTDEAADLIDVDVFLELSSKIAVHSNLSSMEKLATPDPEEGSDAVKGFPAAGSERVVGDGMDASADS